ncbi:MAG TPA: PHP domain-containing protein [Ornithinimicrobium sp.]|uniref:PHP domain-containing protein n=1 Tax=Ornithinimicrobium sp. TaxID=1977084 RepID=UPI002B487E0C|nr:PHP domain-containing protein [Ornithinimicrobium sp.]HKJ11029.1 PHP domain-containing protein [Ornithinimicrobium sp.]
MTLPLDLETDWHTHTSLTDGSDSPKKMVRAAGAAGLHRIHVTDHVRASSTWVPDYVAELDRIRAAAPIDVVCGVEAKILDVKGRVDLPTDLRGIEQVVIADHQFPTRSGPVTPQEMRRRIETHRMRADDAVAELVLATARAVFVHELVVVGHLFSVLPKAGIDVSLVTDEMLSTLAAAVRASGAVIEVNEKWRTPSVPMVDRLCALGVELVPSSDAHSLDALGAWDHVADAAQAVAG